jgi:hypothetical protein
VSTEHRFTTWDQREIADREWGEPTTSPPVALHRGFAASIVDFLT